MYIDGKVTPPQKGEKNWSVEVPLLGIFTQGKSLADARRMAKDAVEILVDRKNFKATLHMDNSDPHRFEVGSSDLKIFLPFVLSRIRMVYELSLGDMAERMNSKSRNAYKMYEKGTMPSVGKLTDLLEAIDPNIDITIRKRA